MNLFYAFEIQFKIQDLRLYYSTAHLMLQLLFKILVFSSDHKNFLNNKDTKQSQNLGRKMNNDFNFQLPTTALSIIWSKSFVRQDTRSLRVQCHFLKLRCPFFVSYYFVLHCEDTHHSKLIPKKCDEIIWMKI